MVDAVGTGGKTLSIQLKLPCHMQVTKRTAKLLTEASEAVCRYETRCEYIWIKIEFLKTGFWYKTQLKGTNWMFLKSCITFNCYNFLALIKTEELYVSIQKEHRLYLIAV